MSALEIAILVVVLINAFAVVLLRALTIRRERQASRRLRRQAPPDGDGHPGAEDGPGQESVGRGADAASVIDEPGAHGP